MVNRTTWRRIRLVSIAWLGGGLASILVGCSGSSASKAPADTGTAVVPWRDPFADAAPMDGWSNRQPTKSDAGATDAKTDLPPGVDGPRGLDGQPSTSLGGDAGGVLDATLALDGNRAPDGASPTSVADASVSSGPLDGPSDTPQGARVDAQRTDAPADTVRVVDGRSQGGSGGVARSGGAVGTGGVIGTGGSVRTGGVARTGGSPGRLDAGRADAASSSGDTGNSGVGDAAAPDADLCPGDRWDVSVSPSTLTLSFGRTANFSEYGTLSTDSGYVRFVYGPDGTYGTSILLAPAFWSEDGVLHRGTEINARAEVLCDQVLVYFNGDIVGLAFNGVLRVDPPTEAGVVARVAVSSSGSVVLGTNRPGGAFWPVTLSAMRISATEWTAASAFIAEGSYALSTSGWILPEPVESSRFGLVGGGAGWTENAPTVQVDFNGDTPPLATGYVARSSDPTYDNVSLWAATDQVPAAWSYKLTITKAL